MPVTTRLDGTRDSAEQAVNTPNDDEERLEQMSHPKNKVMERMTLLERWNGLACSARHGYGKVLLDVVEGVFRDHSVPPKHNAFDSSGCLCLGVTQPLPFLPQGTPRTSHGKHRLRERTNRRLLRQPSKKYSTSRCFAQRSSRARGLIRGINTDGPGDRRP